MYLYKSRLEEQNKEKTLLRLLKYTYTLLSIQSNTKGK